MSELICVGKIKEKPLAKLIDDYCDKIRHIDKSFTVKEVTASIVKNEDDLASIEQAKDEEAIRLLDKISNDDFVVLVDLHGKQVKSETLITWLETANMNYKGRLRFVIAGSYGYGQAIIDRANVRWSLSECTFLHTMIRLLVIEQIYRMYMIQNNRKYHK